MKTQGFTLIELLAVIVILAIIALIATPIVLGIIDDTKESAQLRSAEMYLDGVLNAVMRENMNNGGNFRPNKCIITNGSITCDEKTPAIVVEVDGEVPTSGEIIFENGKIKEVTLNYETATIVKNEEGNLVYSDEESDIEITYTSLGNYEHQGSDGTLESHDVESGKCSKCGENVLEPGVYYSDGTFKNWDTLMAEGGGDENGQLWGGAFYGETELVSIVFSEKTTEVYDGVLEGCVSLENITLHKNIKLWMSKVEYDSLKTVNYGGTKAEWERFCFGIDSEMIKEDVVIHCSDGDIIIEPTTREPQVGGMLFSNGEYVDWETLKLGNTPGVVVEDIGILDLYADVITIDLPIEIVYINSLRSDVLKTINYPGTKTQWNSIDVSKAGSLKITVHCADGDITIPANE